MKNIIKNIGVCIGVAIMVLTWFAGNVAALIGVLEASIICDIVFAACTAILVILLIRKDMKNSRT